MKFVDKVSITVEAGKGGPGAASFRREKYVDKGGPDGGNGGDGGNVIFSATDSLQTLLDLRINHYYKAQNGLPGRGKKQFGQKGKDTIILVPCGTKIFNENNDEIADLTEQANSFTSAKGGKGGKGNSLFATSINRTPRYAQPGLPGEIRQLTLELRLIAQVGLIGLPNAGKSTLLKTLTRANPKIADYPFTTLYPNLGILKTIDKEIIIADIPGLIEGASKGAGLGHQFLRHVDRTKVLVHLVSVENNDPEHIFNDYKTVQNELTLSHYPMVQKDHIILLSKTDLVNKTDLNKIINYFQSQTLTTYAISSATRSGIDTLTNLLYHSLV